MNPIYPISTPGLHTPEKSYPLRQNESGSVQVQWTPTSKKFLGKRVVYRIKNTATFKRYIGQTSQLFKRISSHISRAKCHPDSLFLCELDAHPENFSVGAFETEDPDARESEMIEHFSTQQCTYNRRGGGGGGAARKEPPASPTTVRLAKDFFQKVYQSPTKYPLPDESVREAIPSSTLEKKSVVYRIQRKTACGSWMYVGSTQRKCVKRLCEHLFYGRHPGVLQAGKKALYQALHRHLEQCTFSIIDDSFFLQGLTLSQKEQLVIEFYQKAGYMLYNMNKGGGGGASKE